MAKSPTGLVGTSATHPTRITSARAMTRTGPMKNLDEKPAPLADGPGAADEWLAALEPAAREDLLGELNPELDLLELQTGDGLLSDVVLDGHLGGKFPAPGEVLHVRHDPGL